LSKNNINIVFNEQVSDCSDSGTKDLQALTLNSTTGSLDIRGFDYFWPFKPQIVRENCFFDLN